MRKIEMVDLKSQYAAIREEVQESLATIMESAAFINGPAVSRFAENLGAYLDVPEVIPCANGTDALQLALMALDLKPGDEVISSTFTFIATVEVIALLGLKPVLVDVDPDDFNLLPSQVEAAITPRTKVILPVHLFGQCAEMESLMSIAKRYGLYVIEDACQSIGADYTFSDQRRMKAGTMGDLGCVSFFPSKNLGAYGDGGAIFTRSAELAAKLRSLVNHGMTKRYHHDYIGVNSRLDSLQAAILDIKLKHLDAYTERRRAAASRYRALLADVQEVRLPAETPNSTHVYHQFTIRVPSGQRNDLQAWLASHDIPAMIYYPIPLHHQKAFLDYGFDGGVFPNAERLSDEVLSLPMHSELDDDQLVYISDSIRAFFADCKK